jgi:hypothetical protein
MRQESLTGQLPVATGDLAHNPFGHLVLYVHRRSQTGTLAVTDPRGGQTRVLFQDGKGIAAQLPWDAASLIDGLAPLCGLTSGSYAFYADHVALQNALTGELNAYALIGASIERYARPDVVQATVSRFAGTRLRLARAQRIRDLGLPASDRPLLDLIRAEPASPERLVELSPLGQERTERVLYALLVSNALAPYDTEQLEAHHERVQSSYVVSIAQPSPVRSSPAKVRSLPTPRSSPAGEAASSSPAPQQALSIPASARSRDTFAHVNRVASPLTSFGPPKAEASPLPESNAKELDDALRDAERALKQGKHEEALFPLARLARKHAYSADLHSLRAMILFDRDVNANEPLPADIVALVDEALALDPDQARALYLKGVELKRTGELGRARSYFERAVEEDSTNIAAKRELHLLRK